MTNPFATGPQAAPPIAAQQASPFAQQVSAATQTPQVSAAQAQQGVHPLQAQGAGTWTPAQHEAYAAAQAQQVVAAPRQQPQNFVPQFQAPPSAQQAAPAQAQPSSPFAGVTPQGGGGYDPSLFGAPSAGGGGTFPKVRDLDGRLCLFRTKNRNASGTAYGDPTRSVTNYVVNVAVLDGGPLYSSPSNDQPMAQPTLVSDAVPYVVQNMTIGQIGMQNRLANDFVRGRVVRMPKPAMAAQLAEQFPGVEPWQALWTWLSQDASRVHQLGSGTYFWGIVEDNSPQADQLVAAFAQHPAARELMA